MGDVVELEEAKKSKPRKTFADKNYDDLDEKNQKFVDLFVEMNPQGKAYANANLWKKAGFDAKDDELASKYASKKIKELWHIIEKRLNERLARRQPVYLKRMEKLSEQANSPAVAFNATKYLLDQGHVFTKSEEDEDKGKLTEEQIEAKLKKIVQQLLGKEATS